jgi:4-coumarate--CoA ligase
LVVLIWSSGTTGAPKGVMLSHLNIVTELYIPMKDSRDFAEANAVPNAPAVELRTIAHLPSAHIAGVHGYMSAPPLVGSRVYWMPKYRWEKFLEYAAKYKPTTLYTVPSIYLRIAKSPEVTTQFDQVISASTGAAKMDGDLQKAANAKMGNELTFIGQTWGLSETTGAITAQRAGQHDDTGSISPVLPNMQIRCVDDNSNDVEPGQPGELICKGDIVTKGYFNNPQATAESFHDGWFYTGDVAIEKDGKFYIVDRKKVSCSISIFYFYLLIPL